MRLSRALGHLVLVTSVAWSNAQEDFSATVTMNPEAEERGGNPLAVPSNGTGTAQVDYDAASGVLTWTIEFDALTSNTTTANFHGPATQVETAGVRITAEGAPFESPSVGSANITDEEAADLVAGLWYVNIHTDLNPMGEIRGQIIPLLDLMVALSPEAEELGGTPLAQPSNGTGAAYVQYDPNTLVVSWNVTYANLTSNTTQAHLHGPAARDETAGVQVVLEAGPFESPSVGSDNLTVEQGADLLAGLWYVNVHTDLNPAGELRGQVAETEPVFSELVYLTTRAEVLGGTPLMVPSDGSGMAQVDYDPNNLMLSWNLTYANLSSPTTQAHFHGPAGPEETAGVQLVIEAGQFDSPSEGMAVISSEQGEQLLDGLWYINVHTSSNPAGELRGQVAEVQPFSELVYLTTRAEIEGGTPLASPSDGSGMAQVDFDPETRLLSWNLSFQDLSSATTQAHFHGPALPTETAGVEIVIEAGPFLSPSIGSAELSPEQAVDLLAGLWYINVHTELNPAGELRGQVAPLPVFDEMILLTTEAEIAGGTPLQVPSQGSGTADVMFDPETRALSWTVTYAGLSSATTAAHFHGPAEVDETGPLQVVIEAGPFQSPTTGSEILSQNQSHDLLAGLWYVNLHTSQNPMGELRGQVAAQVATPMPVPTEIVYATMIDLTGPAVLAGGTPLLTPTDGMGTATIYLTQSDPRILTWEVEFAFVGTATALHFHGPATPLETAGVQIVMESAPFDSPSIGAVEVTLQQVAQLLDDMWYINLHTEDNPMGELRGQVVDLEDMGVPIGEPDVPLRTQPPIEPAPASTTRASLFVAAVAVVAALALN